MRNVTLADAAKAVQKNLDMVNALTRYPKMIDDLVRSTRQTTMIDPQTTGGLPASGRYAPRSLGARPPMARISSRAT